MDSAYFPAHWYDGQALAAMGRNEDAVSSFMRAIEIAGRTSRLLGYLGYALGRAGCADEARALLAELDARASEDYVPPYFRAVILAGLGLREEALDEVERALERRDTMVRDLALDTPWWAYRDDERYRALVGRWGL